MLKQYYKKDNIEIGIDEAGRGCLFGPVCVAGVIWLDKDPSDKTIFQLKDSKKCSEKQLPLLRDYILENCIAYHVEFIDNNDIDKLNILESTIKGMHNCISNISKLIQVDRVLIDGPHFNFYEGIPHSCIIDGDNTYKSIAAASILAKTFRDDYIKQLVKDNEELLLYDIHNNKGYGTKNHIESIKSNGITKWHRKTFGICKNY